MDKTIPMAAAAMLDFLGNIEAPKGYNTIYGNNQSKLPKPLTSMTLGEVIAAGPGWTKRFMSSACGRYQFMNNTLKALRTSLKLNDSQVFSADLQDRLAFHLLRGRGYDKWASGAMTATQLALGLSKEWASIPVLGSMRGNSRDIVRGQSYYAGDSLNKALVKAESVEELMRKVALLPKNISVMPAAVFAETPAAPVIATEPVVNGGAAPVPGMEVAGEVNRFVVMVKDVSTKLRTMNPEQAASLFRTGLQIIGTYLTTHGFLADEDWQQILGPLVIALTTIWGVWARSDKNLMASAAAVPAVKAVVVDSREIENKVSDYRVTTEDTAKVTGIL